MKGIEKWKIGIIVLIIILMIEFISSFQSPPQNKNASHPSQNPSSIFKIPPGATVTRDTNGNPAKYKKGDRIILEVLIGPHKDLIFMNENIPHIRITKKRTFIRGVGPNNIINKVKLMNTGKEEVFVEVEVQKLRHRT
ncbi:MAG: hypothetical protein ISS02_01050 [Candidatus Portnoybacteria bacterium]|nr:hypothetical protein [Candidatus Portnoybacteria bacterium]